MADDVLVRRYTDEDMPAVLDVMRAALGEPPGLGRTPDLFAWKHLENPFGRSIMLVAEAEGRVAGFRAFMRWRLTMIDGQELSCVRAVDTATHPDFQRRGIFRSLTTAGIEAATDDGVDLIFNTPNDKSGAGYLSMGWSMVAPIGVMARPGSGLLRTGLLGSGERVWPEAQGHETGSAIAAGILDPLLSGHRKGLRTSRSREYYEWRFASHPTAQYVVAGAEASAAVGRLNTRNGRLELVVSELAGSDAPRAVGRLIRDFKPDYTVGWFSQGTTERRLGYRSGLVPVPRVSSLTLVARPLRPLDVDVADISSWDLAFGDLELL